MFYRIQKSLGRACAVEINEISQEGICIEFKNFNSKGASIIIYNNGKLDDICINGHAFPCIYNNIIHSVSDDIYGGESKHYINFEYLDLSGNMQCVEEKTLYGQKESLAVEYFYSLLYNISCCKNKKQYELLYKLIIDNDYFGRHKNRKEAIKVLDFIESFTSQYSVIEDTEYLSGLKQKIAQKFKEAQEIISITECPK